MRRRIAQASVLMLLVGTLVVVVPTTAQAHHYAGTNGCTMVPDSGPTFNFHAACDQHDLCYMDYRYGRHEPGRYQCDVQFYWNMARDCQSRWAKSWCYTRAAWYYNGVRWFGSWFFWDPNRSRRAYTNMA